MRPPLLAIVLCLSCACGVGPAGTPDAGTLDAGTPDAGTPDAGAGTGSWTHLQGAIPTNASVDAMAAIGSTLIVSTGDPGIAFRTSDHGATWTSSALSTDGGVLVPVYALSARGTTLFASADDVYESADNGASWRALHAVSVPVNMVSVGTAGGSIFVGPYAAGLLSSRDDGATWQPTGLTIGYVHQMLYTGVNLLVADAFGDGVSISPDLGTTFTPANTGLPNPANNSMQSLAIHGNVLFAGSGGNGVYTSTNGGASWAASNTGMITPLLVNAVQALLVNGNTIYAGTDQGVFSSTNDGASWRYLSGDIPTYVRVDSLATDGTYLYAGMYSAGLWRHAL